MSVTEAVNFVAADREEAAARFAEVVRYNIRRYMRLTGKLQKDLAKAMGVTRPAVTQMLNGTTKIKLEQLYLAARELGVTVNDLIDDTYYRQDEDFVARMQENEKTVAGNSKPRFFVSLLSETEFVAGHGFEPWTSGL
ncbi:helix-turn-helix domain-containing protein [Bifidobacterium callimiconis]|uniref:helix-turn-helix domain-containing protein n=1 Tax=Bifidobacterium callimiconis TaxID=2306973 RepID=UPI000F7F4F1A